VPLRCNEVEIRRAVSATGIIEIISLSDKINSEKYTGQVLATVFDNLSDHEKVKKFLQQDGANIHTAK